MILGAVAYAVLAVLTSIFTLWAADSDGEPKVDVGPWKAVYLGLIWPIFWCLFAFKVNQPKDDGRP